MGNQFDKFVEDLEKREKAQNDKKKAQSIDEKNWHTRKLREMYQEKPDNRITWGNK